MIRESLAAWIAIAVPHLVDPQGHHFAAHQLPHEAADAFATVCTEADPFPLDTDGRLCGAFLLVMAGLESGFQLHPRGQSWDARANIAQGPFGEWRGGDARTTSWLSSTRHYLGTVREAIVACPDAPISRLAGERCGGRVHVARWAQIKTLVAIEGVP